MTSITHSFACCWVMFLVVSCSSQRQAIVTVTRSETNTILVTYCNESHEDDLAPKFMLVTHPIWTKTGSDTLVVRFPCSPSWIVRDSKNCPIDWDVVKSKSCIDVVKIIEEEQEVGYIYFPYFGEISGVTVRVPSTTVFELSPIIVFTGGLGETK